MGFFDKLNRAWSQADFWDKKENAQQKASYRDEDDERKRREREVLARQRADAQSKLAVQRQQREQQQQPQAQSPQNVVDLAKSALDTNRPVINNNIFQPVTKPQQNNPLNIEQPTVNQRTVSVAARPIDPLAQAKQQALQKLEEENLPRAIEEEKNRTSWFDRSVTDRDWIERARNAARMRAATQYQEKNGWNADPTVLKYGKETSERAGTLVDNSAKLGRGLKTVEDVTNKVADVASYVPVTGTVMDWGLRGLETAGVEDAADAHKRLALGLSAEEYNSLDPEMKKKLDILSGAGTAAGVLDFTGLGGYANLTRKIAVKQSVKELIDQVGVKQATKILTKRAGAAGAKTVIPATGVGTGISIGAQGYLGGWDNLDPLEALKTGLMVGGTSVLDPSQGTRNIIKNTDTTQNAVKNSIDASSGAHLPETGPPRGVDAPQKIEVAPGVLKTVEDVPQTPVNPAGVPVPPTNPQPAPGPSLPELAPPGTTTPIQAGVRNEVPQAPQTINPEIQKQVQLAQQQVDNATVAPQVEAQLPTKAPVTTPIKQASEAAPAPVAPVNKADDVAAELKGRRESLEAERDSRRAEGLSTKDIDRQIKALDDQIRGKNDVLDDPEADALVKEASGKIDKNLEEASTTKKLIDEQRKYQEGSDNSPEYKADKNSRLDADEANMAAGDTRYKDEAREIIERTRRGSDMSRVPFGGDINALAKHLEAESAPPKPEIDRTEGFDWETANRTTPGRKFEAPAKGPAEELPSKPVKPTAAELQKGARENVTKSGKVTAAWQKAQRKAGADAEELRSAIEKVEGRKAPPTPEEQFTDESVKTIRDAGKKSETPKTDNTVKAAPKVAERAGATAAKATGENRFKKAIQSLGATREKASYEASWKKAGDRDSLTDAEYLADIDSIVKPDVDGAPKTPSDHVMEVTHANERLTEMLVKAQKSGDKKALGDIADAYEKITNVGTKNAAERGEGLGALGWATKIQSPALVANHYKTKLQRAVKAAGGDPEKAITDAEFVKYYDGKKKVSDTATEITKAREKVDGLREKVGTSEQPSRKEMEVEWDNLETQQRKLLDEMDEVDKVVGDIKDRNVSEGNLPKDDSSWIDVYEAHTKGAMLSGLTGRTRDLAVTKLLNQSDSMFKNVIEATFGKIASFATGKTVGRYQTVRSSKEARRMGWRKTVQGISDDWKGRSSAGYLGETAAGGTRSEIPVNPTTKKRNWFLKSVHSLTALPTHLTQTTNTKRLYQMGMTDAKKAGLKGEAAELFADSYIHNAPKDVQLRAEQEMLAISAMHDNPVTDFFVNGEEGLRAWANKGPKGPKKTAKRLGIAQGILLVAPFKKFMAGSLHYAANKNAVAQFSKLVIKDVPAYKAAKKAGDVAGMTKAMDDAISHAAGGVWDMAKVTAATALIVPMLSETDANGDSYSPPYLKLPGTETYVPMSTFGFASAPIIHAYALQKGMEGMKEENPVTGMTRYGVTMFRGIMSSTGLDNVATGDNGIGRLLASWGGGTTFGSENPEDGVNKVSSRLAQDIVTQWTPALARDVSSLIDTITGQEYAPETKVYNHDGSRNWGASAMRTVGSAIPGVSQSLPRSETKATKTIWDRFRGSNTSSKNFLDDKQQTEDTMSKTTESLKKNNAFSDESFKNLVSDDSEKSRLLEKLASGDTEGIQQSKIDALVTDFTTAEAQKQFIENGKFKTYKSSLQMELDKLDRDPNSSDVKKSTVKRDITRADLADTNKIDSDIYRYYTGDAQSEGGGISQSEFKELMESDDPKDVELAEKLWALDLLFTKNKVSANSKGVDPWGRQKYHVPKGGWKKGGSGSGSKPKAPSTDFGMIGRFGAPSSGLEQKYKKLSTVMPNTTTQTAKTSLKKKISVARGVRL